MKEKILILFSGYNQRAITAFLRTLEKNKVEYAIIAKSKDDPIFLTKYKNKVVAIREYIPLILTDLLTTINKVKLLFPAEEYVIAPSTEALNRFLLQNREVFLKEKCTIPLVNKSMYENISDKYDFGKKCKEEGILIPNEFKKEEIREFPVVAKPIKYFSTSQQKTLSPIIMNSQTEWENFLKDFDFEDFYFQEYIEGKCLYLLYYFHRDGTIFKFSQENLVQQSGGKSMLAAVSSAFHTSAESDKYEKLFKSLNFYGFLMVEVKQKYNKNYMIEANPRFWGPSQLFVDEGINFFEFFLHDYGFLNSLPEIKLKEDIVKYFWFGGLMSEMKNRADLTFYNIKENHFFSNLHDWLTYDVYKREDTLEIFKRELMP